MSQWTEADIACLTDRWHQGWTSGAIAAQLGKTRNAVLGKLKRLGLLKTRAKDAAYRQHHRTYHYKSPRSHRARQRPSAPGLPTLALQPKRHIWHPPEPHIVPGSGRRNLPLLECDPFGCRYGTNDIAPYVFCNAPSVPGHAWCEFHYHVVYQPRVKPMRIAEAAE